MLAQMKEARERLGEMRAYDPLRGISAAHEQCAYRSIPLPHAVHRDVRPEQQPENLERLACQPFCYQPGESLGTGDRDTPSFAVSTSMATPCAEDHLERHQRVGQTIVHLLCGHRKRNAAQLGGRLAGRKQHSLRLFTSTAQHRSRRLVRKPYPRESQPACAQHPCLSRRS